MANVIINDTHLNNIASAIREKNGTTTKYKPAEMAAAISAIETGSGSSEWQPPFEGLVYSDSETHVLSNSYLDTNQAILSTDSDFTIFVKFKGSSNNNLTNGKRYDFLHCINEVSPWPGIGIDIYDGKYRLCALQKTVLTEIDGTDEQERKFFIDHTNGSNSINLTGDLGNLSLSGTWYNVNQTLIFGAKREMSNVFTNYWSGEIYQILIYNRVLTNEEKSNIYEGVPTIKITEDGKYNVSSYDIANVKVLDSLTETLKITSNDIYNVKNYANVDVVVPSTGEWTPEEDWWDIKTILENDTEDYLSKIIYLYISKPNQKITINYNYWSTNLAKMVFSDGTTIIENGTYVLDDLNAKECSKGYKTKYVILYFNTQTPFFGYTNLSGITGLVDDVLYVYIKDVACFDMNSSWGFYGFQLQAVESNLPVKLNQNYHFCYVNSPTFEKLPYFEGYNITAFNKGNFFGSSFRIKKEQFIRKYASLIALDDASGGMSNMNCFYGEVIDFLEDFGLDTSIKTSFNSIYGPLHIVSLDFNSCTSWNNGGCQVSSIGEIRNIKASCSWFSNANYVTYDILLKVLDALYDYAAEGSTNTYTLTLGTTNLAKLTDEEKAIATNKGWTLA